MKTPNYNLKKTELTDTFEDWIDNDAENWDIVDSALKSADEKSAEDISFTDTFNIADGATNVDSALINIGTKADTIKDRKYASVVVGTTQSGHTLADCDYLCDGTADQVKINTAIAALPADGGEIIILDGTYNITAKINLNKSNVTISGDGNSTILKRMYNSGSAEGVITLTSANYCKIKDLQIDGNKATYDSSNNIGIRLISGSNNTVTGNTCNNNNNGIYLTSSSNNTVTGNSCNGNAYGIVLTSGSNNTVTGNSCNGNAYGIVLISSSNNTVTGNTCNNNISGIVLISSSNNNTVTGNTCNNNTSYGIYLTSSSNNTVTGNSCNGNAYGIYLTSSSNNNTVTGNTCNNNTHGIYLTSSSNNNTVTGNTCNDNNIGIRLDASSNNNTVTGNTCIRGTGLPDDYTASQYAIILTGATNNYNLIATNNCMGKAVVVGGGTGNSVYGNKWDVGNDLP
jgi:parallel beta-helix repeat protein